MFRFPAAKFFTSFIAFLPLIITVASSDAWVKDNIIKIFPYHSKSDNNLTACTGIALNEKYFVTTQICAAQTIHYHTARIKHKKNDKLTGKIEPNAKFTVGWNNNFVVGNFELHKNKKPLKSIQKLKILKSATVIPGKSYELIGFNNHKSMETFNFQVQIQPSNVCENAKFEANKHFKFHQDTEICAEISTDNLSTLNYGSILIDKNDQNNIIGILSILTKLHKKNAGKTLMIITRLSSYCDYLFIGTEESFLCS